MPATAVEVTTVPVAVPMTKVNVPVVVVTMVPMVVVMTDMVDVAVMTMIMGMTVHLMTTMTTVATGAGTIAATAAAMRTRINSGRDERRKADHSRCGESEKCRTFEHDLVSFLARYGPSGSLVGAPSH
jgi:ribulose kinase